jgi:hypothetical protein
MADGKNPRKHAQLISSFTKYRPLWGLLQSITKYSLCFIIGGLKNIHSRTNYLHTNDPTKVKKILPHETVIENPNFQSISSP